ncbi:MAG: nicotinamide-nucleotide adenylyltransferase [Thermoplasmata archaeon]|nr:nicotinamide-nucleotide adenylyltransferase [Thermoplasmata archaeon]
MHALFIGRFQPFHLGHLKVVREISKEFEPVIVIGSAEVSHTLKDPFTAGERYLMISRALRTEGIKDFSIIPIRNVNRYGIWVSHIRTLVPPFDAVFTNNPLTVRLFSEAGYTIRSPVEYSRGKYCGRHIRKQMLEGGEWRHLLPEAVAGIIEEFNGVERLRDIAGPDGFQEEG